MKTKSGGQHLIEMVIVDFCAVPPPPVEAPYADAAPAAQTVQVVRRASSADPGVDWLLEQVRAAAK